MEIDEWWPLTPEVVRRRLINHPWSPVALYVMEQVHLAGGPAPDSGWWQSEREGTSGELFLPQEAHLWILKRPDAESLNRSSGPRGLPQPQMAAASALMVSNPSAAAG